jgi:hypothetical protein
MKEAKTHCRNPDPNKIVHGHEYEMRTYFDAIVLRYCEIAGIERISLRHAPTPFIDEAKDPSGVVAQGPKLGVQAAV